MTRDQILGLTVVTGKGDILTLNGGMLKCHRLWIFAIYSSVQKEHLVLLPRR